VYFIVHEGTAKLRSDDWERVVTEVELIAGLLTPGTIAESKLEKAALARAEGDLQRSLEILRELISSGAAEFELTCRTEIVRALLTCDNYEDSVRELEELRRRFPNEWYSKEVADLRQEVRDLMLGGTKGTKHYINILAVRPTQHIQEEVTNHPDNPKLLIRLAQAQFEHCQYAEALKTATEAIEVEGFEGASYKALLEMLAVLGPDSELVDETWEKLKQFS
jgi:thioredoxin-like negative regulator of GroEL